MALTVFLLMKGAVAAALTLGDRTAIEPARNLAANMLATADAAS